MGTGTQAHQLHSPQTGLGSLCVCVCVCTRVCVRAHMHMCAERPAVSPLLVPQDAWLAQPLFLGGREFPVALPAENWPAGMCIW